MRNKDMDIEPKQTIIETSKIIYGNTLYEQIYEPDTKETYFLKWDNEKQQAIRFDEIIQGNNKYLPCVDKGSDENPLETKAVLLPSGICEYGDEKTLEQEIKEYIYTYSDVTDEHRQLSTWYIMLTQVTENINTIPYLRALGDYGTGKTRYEDVIGGLCYKAMFVGGSVRSPPIYRVISKWRGTAIFDEFTLKDSDESEDIIKILNNGYERGKPVLRCSGDNYDNVKYFDPFCPKVISSRTQFEDQALESRCITEVMKETDRIDIPISLSKTFFEKRLELRNKLLLYRFRNWDKIKTDETSQVDFGHIQPRVKQSYLPFTVLFLYDKKTLDNFILNVKSYNNKLIEESSTSYDGLIVNIFISFKKGNFSVITPTDIRNELVNKYGFKETLKPTNVGKRLKALGFISKPVKVDEKTQRVLDIEDNRLKHLIYRYVPSEDHKETINFILKEKPQKELDGVT